MIGVSPITQTHDRAMSSAKYARSKSVWSDIQKNRMRESFNHGEMRARQKKNMLR
jgi:hypothetical protein